MVWSGRVVSALVVLLFLMDAGIKILKTRAAMEGAVHVGYPENTVVPMGIVLLICTILYALPRTSVLGAMLLTGYLGGAVATNVRVSNPLFTATLFPVYIGILVWGGLWLRNARLRELLRNV
jgi:hypothetical protein